MIAILLLLASLCTAQKNDLESMVVPGDIFKLDCIRDPKLNGIFTVGEDGLLTLPYGAPLPVEGLVVPTAQTKIRGLVGRYLVGSDDIEVTVVRKMIRCKAIGHVGNPGWKSLPVGSDVQDLLRAADGMKDGSQMDKLMVSNRYLKEEPQGFDMTRYLQREAGRSIRPLRNGDIVFVPLSPVMGDIQRTLMPYVAPPAEGRRNVVNILGEIEKPGVYEINNSVTVLDMIAMAGGPTTPRNSALVLDLENIKVIHQEGKKSATRTFNLSKYFETGDPALLIPVQAGDNILVPAKKADVEDKTKVVSVVGAVDKPVTWELSGPSSIVQILARSGGFATKEGSILADPSNIMVVSTDSVEGIQVRRWDWNAWTNDPYSYPMRFLRPNDVVVVPYRKAESRNGEFQTSTATVLGSVRSPGLVPVGDRTDILQAIALAGGLDMVEADARVVLVREVEGRTTRTVFHVRDFFERDAGHADGSAVCTNDCPSPVPQVRPGDRIWVDRKTSREATEWLELAYRASVAVAVALALWTGGSQ